MKVSSVIGTAHNGIKSPHTAEDQNERHNIKDPGLC